MRVAGVMLVLIAFATGGCGHGGNQTASGARSRPPGTTTGPGQAGSPSPRTSGPNGRLSYEEFQAIVREYRRFEQLRPQIARAHPSARALRAVAAVCAAVGRPGTKLTGLVGQDCSNAVTHRDDTGVLARAVQKCQSSRGDAISCSARAYTTFAAGVRTISSTALAINAELERRGIRGLCARSIGISRPALAQLERERTAADAAAAALHSGDQFNFATAVEVLKQVLSSQPNEPDPLQGIRKACPHAPASTPAPKRSAPTPRRKPSKPRIPQPGDLVPT